ncbi:SFT2-domain-containing protein [Butyriboletus roseoflavus]|nr:SFT2-domain-containing protein [Butyriboletus roseoflavus]
MSSKGWLNLETAGNLVPDNHFFEGDSAFSFLGLTRTQRLYGFSCPRLCAQPPRQHPAVHRPAQQLRRHVVHLTLPVLSPKPLTVLYTIGILVSLTGTGFLIGFGSQIKLMFKPVRLVATILFLASIGLVFVGAFVLRSEILCIVFVIVEYLAYTWYCLSYIPYARSAILKVVGWAELLSLLTGLRYC